MSDRAPEPPGTAVFLVEGGDELRSAAAELLEKLGHAVIAVRGSREALQISAEELAADSAFRPSQAGAGIGKGGRKDWLREASGIRIYPPESIPV